MAVKKVAALCGSTRSSSVNLSLLHGLQQMYESRLHIDIFSGLSTLPHFNPDLDNGTPPPAISGFREWLRQADGILICTPEYAMGVPGSLKNAIDWSVSSCEFSHKPTALITASSVGEKAHAALMETLKVIEAIVTKDTQLIIPFAKTKITAEGVISHTATLLEVQKLMAAFEAVMDRVTTADE